MTEVARYSQRGFCSFAVHYEADENGYRVTSMETEEIGSGPVTNKEGKAFVQSLQHGLESKYAIMGKQGSRSEPRFLVHFLPRCRTSLAK